MSPDAQRFLSLIVERKRLTMADAMRELDLSARGLGGLTGAIQRSANGEGIALPFTLGKRQAGQRMWILRPSVLKELEG